MSTSTDEPSDSIRDRLLKAALECFLADDYHKVSTRKIAEQADANVSMIRYYFGNKEGMYEELISETLSPMLSALDDQNFKSANGFADFLKLSTSRSV